MREETSKEELSEAQSGRKSYGASIEQTREVADSHKHAVKVI